MNEIAIEKKTHAHREKDFSCARNKQKIAQEKVWKKRFSYPVSCSPSLLFFFVKRADWQIEEKIRW